VLLLLQVPLEAGQCQSEELQCRTLSQLTQQNITDVLEAVGNCKLVRNLLGAAGNRKLVKKSTKSWAARVECLAISGMSKL
jgi:hypothetical protein